MKRSIFLLDSMINYSNIIAQKFLNHQSRCYFATEIWSGQRHPSEFLVAASWWTRLEAALLLRRTNSYLCNANRSSFCSASNSSKESETKKYSLKNNSSRLTSAQFLEQIKGQEALNEEFLIPRPAFDAIAEEYDGLLEEVDDWKDKYMRALAETENVRRRSQKQIEDAKHFAIQSFCKDLLEVADILDLACATVKKEDIETNEHLSNLFKGIEMTKTVLEKAFAKHGLGKVFPQGERFDPNLHEAVFQVPKDQAKFAPGYVAEVVKIGYSLKGRPIRAAKVGVVQSV